MNTNLIDAQGLVDSFLDLLPQTTHLSKNTSSALKIKYRVGSVNAADISVDIRSKVPVLFTDIPSLTDEKWRDLYNGDITAYDNDESRADIALAGYLARNGLTPDEMDQVMRTSVLYRDKWDSKRGDSAWLQKYVIAQVCNQPAAATTKSELSSHIDQPKSEYDIERFKPCFVAGGMPPRIFAGPTISDNLKLYPLRALSAVVALGAVGKTSLLIGHACHIAAGKPWNDQPLVRRKVIYFSVEETQEELSRKFSAITQHWSLQERERVIESLLLAPMLGRDVRLVINERGSYQGSRIAERMIGIAHEFGLEDGVIILDHMQGFATGDLNASETATAICREANKIAESTGSAVVFAAHVSKANIKATNIEQGLAVGSLAFENSLRQLIGVISMPEEEAKRYGITEDRLQYSRLEVPKNSYGPSAGGIWLKKIHSPEYHTVVVEPVTLAIPSTHPVKSTNERMLEDVISHLKTNHWVTRNYLDGLSGKDGKFKTSKTNLRGLIAAGIDSGQIVLYTVTPEDRDKYGLAKQVKEVLRAHS